LNQIGPIDTLLQVGGTYGWRMRYRDRNLQWSSWSAERTFVWHGPEPLDPPQRLTLFGNPTATVLRWNRVPGTGLQYNVYRGLTATGPFDTLVGTTTDSTMVDSAGVASPETRGYYIVKAVRP
jgi:hypothetical protein